MTDEIQAAVARYVGGKITADELESQLPDGWEVDRRGDRDARKLLLRIIGYLSEFRNGDLAEGELRRRLLAFSGWMQTPVVVASEPSGITLGKDSATQTFWAGTESQVVHG